MGPTPNLEAEQVCTVQCGEVASRTVAEVAWPEEVAMVNSRSLLVVALLFWAACLTTLLISLTTTSERDCSQRLARSNQRAVDIVVDPSWPTNGTMEAVESEEEAYGKAIKQYWSQIDRKRSTQQNCTLVMQTYKREEILLKILPHYCKIPLLQRILVVWNDVGATVPEALRNLTQSCRADLMYILSEENKLTNRYIPRREIETDCNAAINYCVPHYPPFLRLRGMGGRGWYSAVAPPP